MLIHLQSLCCCYGNNLFLLDPLAEFPLCAYPLLFDVCDAKSNLVYRMAENADTHYHSVFLRCNLSCHKTKPEPFCQMPR